MQQKTQIHEFHHQQVARPLHRKLIPSLIFVAFFNFLAQDIVLRFNESNVKGSVSWLQLTGRSTGLFISFMG